MKTFAKLQHPSNDKADQDAIKNAAADHERPNGLDGQPISNGDKPVNGHTNEEVGGTSNGYVSNYAKGESQRLFLLSAFDEASGRSQVKNLSQYLQDRLPWTDVKSLSHLAYTLGERRSRLSWKAAIRANSAQDLIEKLNDPSLKFKKSTNKPGIAFVFTGQGAQWYAMGRELMYSSPLFMDTLVKAGRYLKSFGSTWDLIGMPPPKVSTIHSYYVYTRRAIQR